MRLAVVVHDEPHSVTGRLAIFLEARKTMFVFFPVAYRFGDNPSDGLGGPAPADDGAVYVCRDEDKYEDYPEDDSDAPPLVLSTSLSEMVSECLEGWRDGEGYTHEDHAGASDLLAAALRCAADMLDAGKRPPLIQPVTQRR